MWKRRIPLRRRRWSATTIENYHGAHGKYETEAPVRTFVPYPLKGKSAPAGGLPLHAAGDDPRGRPQGQQARARPHGGRVRLRQLPAGHGRWCKNEKGDKLLIANSNLPLMVVDPRDVEAYAGAIDAPVETYTAGVRFSSRSGTGIQQMDNLGDAHVVVLRRLAGGRLDLPPISVRRFCCTLRRRAVAAALGGHARRIASRRRADAPHRVSVIGLDAAERVAARAAGRPATWRALAVYTRRARRPEHAGGRGLATRSTARGCTSRRASRFVAGRHLRRARRPRRHAARAALRGRPLPRREPPQVTAVHPSAASLPANALRLYVHFSRPMDAHGRAPPRRASTMTTGARCRWRSWRSRTGLWDPGQTRLTLFFHPGRVKRGVAPGERLGPPLREGRRYRLVVDAAMADAAGTAWARRSTRVPVVAADRAPRARRSALVVPGGRRRAAGGRPSGAARPRPAAALDLGGRRTGARAWTAWPTVTRRRNPLDVRAGAALDVGALRGVPRIPRWKTAPATASTACSTASPARRRRRGRRMH